MGWADGVTARNSYKATALADSFVSTDTVSGLYKYYGVPSDSFVPSDSVTLAYVYCGILSDEASLFDEIITGRVVFRASASDALSWDDLAYRLYALSYGFADELSYADGLTWLSRVVANPSETIPYEEGILFELISGHTVPVICWLSPRSYVSPNIFALGSLATETIPGVAYPLSYSFDEQPFISDDLSVLNKMEAITSDAVSWDDLVAYIMASPPAAYAFSYSFDEQVPFTDGLDFLNKMNAIASDTLSWDDLVSHSMDTTTASQGIELIIVRTG